jgi:hypothetical protein
MARVRKICSKLANHNHSLPGHFVGRDAVRLHKVGRHGSICGGGGVFGGRGKLHVDIHDADLQICCRNWMSATQSSAWRSKLDAGLDVPFRKLRKRVIVRSHHFSADYFGGRTG